MPTNDLMGMGTGYDAVAVIPADGADLPYVGRVWVGGAGNVVLDTQYGSTVTFTGVLAGTVLPVLVKRVRSTSTTATNMVLVR